MKNLIIKLLLALDHWKQKRLANRCMAIAEKISFMGQQNGEAQRHLNCAKDELYTAYYIFNNLGATKNPNLR
jgi:hypothetical protein